MTPADDSKTKRAAHANNAATTTNTDNDAKRGNVKSTPAQCFVDDAANP